MPAQHDRVTVSSKLGSPGVVQLRTPDNRLRHPSWRGLRTDRAPLLGAGEHPNRSPGRRTTRWAHREALLQLARAAQCLAVAVVLGPSVCAATRRVPANRRVPETFVRATHARIQDMLAASGDQPPAGFTAEVVVRPDGPVRIAGRLPDGHRDAAWACDRR